MPGKAIVFGIRELIGSSFDPSKEFSDEMEWHPIFRNSNWDTLQTAEYQQYRVANINYLHFPKQTKPSRNLPGIFI